ncbi:protein of unknown function [Taphrina deformans PYCC 5710]|uniref:CN hydrolase domain-containing protein n=1 Tax=Taphrina deformans (strain PYCC 5710 / ATCC 11124 / CBS 356.35 / IMI 108563 / JCM 9778 / NBRC 8474) TaxID=1097556 RepID=R4XML0_TAPDE|nr:protein of unknown function [Taphrina deformans PYCC 5710]|eukprot:CCG84545.1 protein of unknown function [Taphrina deformans PYCC 5710]
MYAQISLLLLLTIASGLARNVPICSLATIALLHLVIELPPPKTPRWVQVVLLTLCLCVGQEWAQSNKNHDSSNGTFVLGLTGILTVVLQILAVLASKNLIIWLNPMADDTNRRKVVATRIDELIFPMIWLTIQGVLLSCSQTLIGTQTSLYPPWIAGNHLESFLDAVFAQCFSSLLQAIWIASSGQNVERLKATATTSTTKPLQDSVQAFLQRTYLSVSFIGILLCGGLVSSTINRQNSSSIKIGCTRPNIPSSVPSVLQAIEKDFDHGGVMMLLPASSGYIHDVDRFIQFKAEITNITRNSATVVVPTHNFKDDMACGARMLLQIYPLGEKHFLNSYTNTVTKKTGKMLKEKNDIGSTFLTWRSRWIERGRGSLLIATAICLDHEFPEIFQSYHSPDLLLIPNSAWSTAVNVSRIEGIKRFAKQKRTAVLFCSDGMSGYVDPTGRTVTSTAPGSFFVDYNQDSRGLMPGIRIGLWWTLPLSLLLLNRAVQRLVLQDVMESDIGSSSEAGKFEA